VDDDLVRAEQGERWRPASPSRPLQCGDAAPGRSGRSRTWQATGFADASLHANAFAVVATAILTRHLGTFRVRRLLIRSLGVFFVAMLFEFGLFRWI